MANKIGEMQVEVTYTVRRKPSGRFGWIALGVILVLLIGSLPVAGQYLLWYGPEWISAPQHVFADGTTMGHVGEGAVLGSGLILGIACLLGCTACFVRASFVDERK